MKRKLALNVDFESKNVVFTRMLLIKMFMKFIIWNNFIILNSKFFSIQNKLNDTLIFNSLVFTYLHYIWSLQTKFIYFSLASTLPSHFWLPYFFFFLYSLFLVSALPSIDWIGLKISVSSSTILSHPLFPISGPLASLLHPTAIIFLSSVTIYQGDLHNFRVSCLIILLQK